MSEQLYINKQEFQHGLHITNPAPLDDRTIWNGIDTLYIRKENPAAAPLYNRVYKGIQIIIFDEDSESGETKVYSYILKDDSPYLPGTNKDVTARNIDQYWIETSQAAQDIVNGDIAPEIKSIEKYIDSEILSNASDSDGNGLGGITIETEKSDSGVGNTYSIKVNTDDVKVKVINNKITVGDYQLGREPGSEDDILATYKLIYRAPGADEFVDVEGVKINIGKDYLIKDAHQCKAVRNDDGTYTQHIVLTDEVTDEEWDAAEGDVYLHYIWNTKDANDTDAPIHESWLKVSDVIKIDINKIEQKISTINSTIQTMQENATELATQFSEKTQEIEQKIDNIKTDFDNYKTSNDAALQELDEKYEEELAATNATVAKNASDASTAVKNLTTVINASIGKLQDNLDSSFAELKDDIDNINDSIDELKDNIDSSFTDFKNDIDSSFTELKETIDVSFVDFKDAIDSSLVELKENSDTSYNDLYDIVIENEHISTEAFLDLNQRINELQRQLNSLELTVSRLDITSEELGG